MRQLPQDWETLASRAGIASSARAIALASKVATTTITRMIFEGRTSSESVRAVAAALRVDESVVYDLAKVATHAELGPWSPPAEAHHLNGAEREALERLIRVMAKGGTQDAGQAEAEKTTNPRQGGASVTPIRPPKPLPADLAQLAADEQNKPVDEDANPELQRQRESGEESQDEGE